MWQCIEVVVYSIVTFQFATILKGQDGADREGGLTSSPLETLQYLDFSCIISYIVSPENLQCYYIQPGRTIGYFYKHFATIAITSANHVYVTNNI